jgi:hypothetical protein
LAARAAREEGKGDGEEDARKVKEGEEGDDEGGDDEKDELLLLDDDDDNEEDICATSWLVARTGQLSDGALGSGSACARQPGHCVLAAEECLEIDENA